VDKKERDGDEDENTVEDYERVCKIRGMAYLIGLGRSCSGVITRRIRTRSGHIGDGKLTYTQISLQSEYLIMISPVPAHFSLVLNSTITSQCEVKAFVSISPCHDQLITPNTVYTEYCIHRVLQTLRTTYASYHIHRVLHIPRTAYTTYGIHRLLPYPKIDYLPLPASLSSLGRPCCFQFSTFARL
jgi:hypothetical protein